MAGARSERGSLARSQRSERGAVTLFLAIATTGLLAMVGLVVDGGAKVRAVQRADRLAAEAARAAGQAVDLPAALRGEAIRLDRRAAVAAADDYLERAGAQGSVSISSGGRAITVTTTASVPTVFLGLVGISDFTVTGRADVSLVHTEGGVPR
jgi:Flp pilus assembly protein TadG